MDIPVRGEVICLVKVGHPLGQLTRSRSFAVRERDGVEY